MIYNVGFALDTKEDKRKAILNQVTEYEIYSYYLGHAFQVGKKFRSPFRENNSPSFNIYRSNHSNSLLHKDFGDPRFEGDCFSLVMQLHNGISYANAINLVYNDVARDKLRGYLRYTNEATPMEKATQVRKLIQFEPKRIWSAFEKKFWDDIGVTDQWCKYFNIYNAYRLFVDENECWLSSAENPIFIYKIFDKIKAYRPFEQNKSHKWISNTSRFDVQGWEQLVDGTDTIVITKSLKDVAVLRTLGYLAIAPSAESVMIPPKAMQMLRDKYGIKHFIILYDRDHGGMMGTRKMFKAYRETYDITFRFLGKGYEKDIADFRRTHSEHATSRYLYYLLNHVPNAKLTVLPANAA